MKRLKKIKPICQYFHPLSHLPSAPNISTKYLVKRFRGSKHHNQKYMDCVQEGIDGQARAQAYGTNTSCLTDMRV